MFFQRIHDRSHRGALLTNGYIDAINRIAGFKIFTLIDNGIDSNTCFSGLAIADNKFTLSTSDRNHGIDGFQSGLQRFHHRLTKDNSGRFTFEGHFDGFTYYFAFTIQGFAQRIDNTSQHSFAYLNRSHFSGTFYSISFFYIAGGA
ncbi:hypothetical protein SDC9_142368 [bioreactor metagenome]|uniref:Uncharacterized protein n=1 Tax=bioreactor metagenome TaxID=1076179 RepID=A0A645E0X7_9ZZZZ